MKTSSRKLRKRPAPIERSTLPRMTPAKKKKLMSRFSEMYEEPATELVFKNQYQLLVCVMLSAQSTDRKVNEITPALFKKYPNFIALSKADLAEVEQYIRQINYYKTKARHLIAMANEVLERHKGKLPRTHKELIALSGVGNKTANVILSELRIEPALPVDTHVFRVARRLGLASETTPLKVEEELKVEFAPEHWHSLHHWLIFHGRRVCKAVSPLCSTCGVSDLCPSRDLFLKSST